MNSVGFFGGRDRKPTDGYKFAYGETICGGSGAGPSWNGARQVLHPRPLIHEMRP